MNTTVEKFRSITNEMVEICERKNSDYGNSVHDTYVKYGPTSYLVRMEDKINRVRTLTSDKEQMIKDEKVRDTLIDLANYAILMLIDLESDRAQMEAKQICEADDVSWAEYVKWLEGLNEQSKN